VDLNDDGMCFACGPRNPMGLKLEFALEDGKYVTRFRPMPEHQGFAGITHGGIIATILDEVMARLVYVLGHRAVTADMHIRLRKPAVTGEELTFKGWITSEVRRVLECAAEARNPEGELVAEAVGRMIKV
jgi:acyl-coenzyme A thioesterase PaaI-like protein